LPSEFLSAPRVAYFLMEIALRSEITDLRPGESPYDLPRVRQL